MNGEERPPTPPTPGGAHSRELLRALTDDEIREYEMRVTNVLAGHPKKVMCCCTAAFFVFAFLSFGVIGFELSDASFEDKHDIRTERNEAALNVRDLIDAQPTGNASDLNAKGPRDLLRSVPLSSFRIVYDGEGDNVLTLKHVKFIKETEDLVLAHKEYKDFCLLDRYSQGEEVPVVREGWTFASAARPMAGGVQATCRAPELSFSHLMYNYRLARLQGTNWVECNVDTEFAACVQDALPVSILELADGRTEAERRADFVSGGIEPTQNQIEAFAQAAYRLAQERHPLYGHLTYFFDKDFGVATDDTRFHSTHIRSQLLMGGPAPSVDPEDMGSPCHERLTANDCNNDWCEWVDWAGPNRDMQGCMTKQYYEVSSDEEASINEDQQKDVAKWFATPITDDFDDLDGPVDVLYIADGTLFTKFQDILLRDSMLAMVAFFFVYLYLQIHTGSFMLASLGMFQVIMPFPMAYFVYYSIFGIKNFYGLSTLTLFIVLGIGADDIFVFMDAWVQANERPRNDTCTYLRGRFTHAWKISGMAMAITSVTTMSAFIATMSTPLDEVAFFGAFAALLVFFDYMLVMTFFACSVVVYHKHSEYSLGCCCCGTTMCGAWFNCCSCFTTVVDSEDLSPKCMQTKLTEPKTCDTIEQARAVLGPLLDFTHDPVAKEGPRSPHADDQHHQLSGDPEYKKRKIAGYVLSVLGFVFYLAGFLLLKQMRTTEQSSYMTAILVMVVGLLLFCAAMNAFRASKDRMKEMGIDTSGKNMFVTKIAPFVSGKSGIGAKPGVRFIPAILMVLLWTFLVYRASELTPTTKSDQYLPDWHPIQRLFNSLSNDFPSSARVMVQEVSVVIGVDADDPLDRSDWDRWNKTSRGTAILYDSSTKLADYSSVAFQTFVLKLCDEVLAQTLSGKTVLQRTDVLSPPTLEQNCFMRGFAQHITAQNKDFPVPPVTYLQELWSYTRLQESHVDDGGYLHPSAVHSDKVLFSFDDPAQPPTGIDGYILTFNTTLKEHGNSNSLLKDWYREWRDFIEDIEDGKEDWVNAIYTDGFPLKGQIMQCSDIWVWMHTQDVLVRGAIQGTVMSLFLAAVVVFIGTMNAWIAVLVLVELIGVVGYVLGLIQLIGWELGTIESVAVTILVGLSVDYVVHLAVHYTHCHVEEGRDAYGVQERQNRVFITAVEMGPTVLGGAATSAGTALVLLLTWVQFFYKFGICFLFTILFSYIWSMFFFLPLMSLVGPQGDFASIRPWLVRCFPNTFSKGSRVGSLADQQEMDAKALPERSQNPLPPLGTALGGVGAPGQPIHDLGGMPKYTPPHSHFPQDGHTATFQNNTAPPPVRGAYASEQHMSGML